MSNHRNNHVKVTHHLIPLIRGEMRGMGEGWGREMGEGWGREIEEKWRERESKEERMAVL